MWDNRGLFAIQGPKAAEVMQRLSPAAELKSVPFGQCFWMTLEGSVRWLSVAFWSFSGAFWPCFCTSLDQESMVFLERNREPQAPNASSPGPVLDCGPSGSAGAATPARTASRPKA